MDTTRSDADAIAIVGMGCRLPGDISSPDSFWDALVSEFDAIGEVPEKWWEFYSAAGAEHASAVRRNTSSDGFVSDVDATLMLSDLSTEEQVSLSTGVPWFGLRDDDLRAYLATEVAAQVAAELKLAAEDLDTRRPLIEMGLDSVMTQTIRARLERQFRVSLPATLLWNRPTVQAIGDFLAELLVPEPSQPDEPDEQGPLLPPAVAA